MGKEDMVKYTAQACSIRNVLLGEMIIFLYALQVLQYCFISCVYECMWFLIVRILKHILLFLQAHSVSNTMPKKGKNKSKVANDESDIEIMPQVEIIYEDTKSVTGAEPKFKWGQIYHML